MFKYSPAQPVPYAGIMEPDSAIVRLSEAGGDGRDHQQVRDIGIADLRTVLANDNGEEWQAPPTPWTRVFRTSGSGSNWISVCEFRSYPRRGTGIGFKLYNYGISNQWDLLADSKAKTRLPVRIRFGAR